MRQLRIIQQVTNRDSLALDKYLWNLFRLLYQPDWNPHLAHFRPPSQSHAPPTQT